MKKTFNLLTILAVAAISFLACSKEEQEFPAISAEDGIQVIINAGAPVTMTGMSGSTPYWCDGDAIGVSNQTKDNNRKFNENSIADGATASTATFSGSVAEAGTYYAYYPYTANGVAVDGAKVDIPLAQHPTSSSFDGAADILVSKAFTVSSTETTTVNNLEFARLGAIVKVVLIDDSVTYDLSAEHPAEVSLTASSNLVGRVYVDMKNQELGDLYNGQSTTVTAEYTAGTKFAINGSNAAYFVVYPQTLAEGSTLTINASTENYSISKDITVPTGGIAFEGGKMATLNVSLADSHISAASTGDALPFNDDMAWANNGASDATVDISSSISTASSGLYVSASKAYKGIGGLKLGSSSASGSITTKELDLSGAFYIAIESGAYGSDTGKLDVTVDETKVISAGTIGSLQYVNIAASTYTTKSKVTIATTSKRAYIYSVKIKSGTYAPDPVINVTSENPMPVSNANVLYAIEYNISNPNGASISASADVSWIHDFDYSTPGEVSFEVDAQSPGADSRTGNITLSYTGADDVVVEVNQAAGSGGKTEYTATLAISSGVTSNTTLTDDKGNSWSLTAVTNGWNSNSGYIHIGSNSKAATSITLTTSAYSSVDIKEIHVWAAAKASTNVTTKISIDGTLLGTSSVLGNTISSGGTEYSITNTTNESGDISVVISRPSSANGAIYFKKLEVVYED